jgi:outer membrane protein assembly factor BamB/tRNA A-37 threonylcarbamoyl transferase component Bud32
MVDTTKFGGGGGSSGSGGSGDSKKLPSTEGTLQVGSTLQNRYKITGILGVGGMGSVYQARDMHFPTVQRYVAVKEMLNLAADPNLRELTLRNFEREANILAELSHPAIPKIYDYFSNRDRAYLVMEYINGKDLEAIINSQPEAMPMKMVLKWSLEICDVLSYLHMHQPEPIIFRDVKPSNIMIDQSGNVRLIDFGIAKTFQVNQKGTMIGTEGYSPPEQYRGEASPAGDIYAVGATLHHVLTRRDPRLEPPFSFNERPIQPVNPLVSPELEAIVMRALAYEPAQRFPNAKAMKDAIESLARGSQGSMMAGDDVAAQEAFADFGEAGKIAPIWTFVAEDDIRSTPVVYKGLVYVGAYDNNLYALNASNGGFKWKFPTEGGIVGTPGIAVDENLIVFGSEDNSLYAVDLITGKIQWSFQTGASIRGSVNVEHGHVFFGSDDGKLYALRLTTGRLIWKYDCGAPVRSRPAITSDRIVVGMESGDVVGLDLSGAIKWRFKAKRAVTSSPTIVDEIAYIGSQDWHVYALDIVYGSTVWRVRTNKPIISSPLVSGKALYIGSADGYMYALDITANGREIWKFDTKGQIISSPVLANGAIYFGGVNGKVYSLEMKKGKLRWEFDTGGPIAASAAVADGIVYIGSTDHTLYALNP